MVGREGKNVRIRFAGSAFNVERSQNDTDVTCWDYVEVRDGDGPYSPLIGRFCGDSPPADVASTRNFLWVKFFSDSTDSRAGFTASVANVNPVCGSHEVVNVTAEARQLVSPGFPSNYPANARCRWVLSAVDRRDKVHIKFVDLNLEQSDRCEKDFIRLEDQNNMVG